MQSDQAEWAQRNPEQFYSEWDLSTLLGVPTEDLLKGERGLILKSIQQNYGGFYRPNVDRWISAGKPTNIAVISDKGTVRRAERLVERGFDEQLRELCVLDIAREAVRALCRDELRANLVSSVEA